VKFDVLVQKRHCVAAALLTFFRAAEFPEYTRDQCGVRVLGRLDAPAFHRLSDETEFRKSKEL